MPEYLKRRKYAPTESEIEAIQVRSWHLRSRYRRRTEIDLERTQSGGATEATAVTRETKLTWYTEQI